MRFSLAVAALAPVLSAYAEDILVMVGAGNTLTFSPPNVTANVGDTIAFQFQSKNHSVTQSTFANPCQIQTTPAQGIDSGFQFVDNTSSTLPQWSFTVNNASAPLWFFCAQTGHCQKGMVFSVNAKPDGPKSFAVYQAAAMGNAPEVESAAAASASAAPVAGGGSIGSVLDSAAAAATSAAGGAIAGAGSAIDSAAGAAATDAANAINSGASNIAAGLTNGGASPTQTAGSSSNSTAPGNSGFRVGGSAMSLVAAVGLTVMLL